MCYNQKQGAIPTNLDKRIVALPSVQVPREIMTSNGCHVSLHFRAEENPRQGLDATDDPQHDPQSDVHGALSHE